jgi:hypothetical protein
MGDLKWKRRSPPPPFPLFRYLYNVYIRKIYIKHNKVDRFTVCCGTKILLVHWGNPSTGVGVRNQAYKYNIHTDHPPCWRVLTVMASFNLLYLYNVQRKHSDASVYCCNGVIYFFLGKRLFQFKKKNMLLIAQWWFVGVYISQM